MSGTPEPPKGWGGGNSSQEEIWETFNPGRRYVSGNLQPRKELLDGKPVPFQRDIAPEKPVNI